MSDSIIKVLNNFIDKKLAKEVKKPTGQTKVYTTSTNITPTMLGILSY